MDRFRTQPVQAAWDLDWVTQVDRHATAVWVRLGGLWIERDQMLPQRFLLQWENAALALTRHFNAGGGNPAYALIRDPWIDKWFTLKHLKRLERWAEWDEPGAEYLRRLLTQLRRLTKLPIGIWADDFSSRWLARSGVRFDWTVFDSPMISLHEAQEYMAGGSAIVRRTSEIMVAAIDTCRMHFGVETSLINSVPSANKRAYNARRTVHGYWSKYDRGWLLDQARGGPCLLHWSQ